MFKKETARVVQLRKLEKLSSAIFFRFFEINIFHGGSSARNVLSILILQRLQLIESFFFCLEEDSSKGKQHRMYAAVA